MTTLAITCGKGVRLVFDNGYELSIQIGAGNYSQNYHAPFPRGNEIPTLLPSDTAEVAVFYQGEWCSPKPPFDYEPHTDVLGYVPMNEVLDLINAVRNLPAKE